MRVFLTGASGFIGQAIVEELRSAGHDVLGLAHADSEVEILKGINVEAHRGELTDHASLAAGASQCDGVIHTAFIHNFGAFEAAAETDRQAVDAMCRALEGSEKPLVSTSVTLLLAPGRQAIEKDEPAPGAAAYPRHASEATVLDAANRGVRSSVVRLPPSVHGAGDHGLVPAMIEFARQKGFSAYVGDGSNRWPAVHRRDAARVFRRALERAAPGSRFHAVSEEGVPHKLIAQTIGEGLGVPYGSITAEQASAHFDWLARFAPIDNPVSSDFTRKVLGWQPQEPELLADMRETTYF